MNNYYYVVRYFDSGDETLWITQRGTVAGNSLTDAMKNLENYYPDIERASLYCLEGSHCGCLELDILDEARDEL